MAMVLRMPALVLAAALTTLGVAQDLSRRITLTESGAAASDVLAAISKQADLELRAGGELGREPLILAVDKVPLSELMPRIARVLGGEWEHPKEGVYELTYSPAAREADRKAHLAAKTAALQKSVEEAAKTSEIGATWTAKEFRAVLEKRKILNERRANSGTWDAYQAYIQNEQKLPIGRAIARLSRLIDLRDIAALDWDERTVYSTAPTKMQRAFPAAAMAALQALNREHAATIDAASAVPDGERRDMDRVFADVPQRYRQDLPRPISRIHLVAQCRGMFNGIELTMTAYDALGNIALQGQSTLVDVRRQENKLDFANDKAVITFSAQTVDYLRPIIATSTSQATEDGTITPDTLEAYRHPERYEPLRFGNGDALVATAKSQRLQLVATLTDRTFLNAVSIASGKSTVGQFIQNLSWLESVVPEDGWLLVRPFDRFEAIRYRTPRGPLGKYLMAVSKSAFVSLDDQAEFAVAFPYPEFASIGVWHERALGKGHVIWSVGMLDSSRRALRFWGLLSPAQKQGLQSGLGLPFAQLSPTLRAELEYLTFRSADATVDVIATVEGGGTSMRLTEPTLTLPNGLPPDGSVFASERTRTLPFSFGSRGGFIQALSSSTLGMNRMAAEDGNEGNAMVHNRFRMGVERALTLRMAYSPSLRKDHSLVSGEVDMSKPTIAYEGLPADFRKAVEAEIQRQKDWRAKNNIKPAPPTKNPPPPRP